MTGRCGVRCLRVLRLPVYAQSGGFTQTAVKPEPGVETRSFLLKQEPTGRIFYECEGCGMCGCPSFDFYPGGMPQEIQDHLMWHAQLCGGV